MEITDAQGAVFSRNYNPTVCFARKIRDSSHSLKFCTAGPFANLFKEYVWFGTIKPVEQHNPVNRRAYLLNQPKISFGEIVSSPSNQRRTSLGEA